MIGVSTGTATDNGGRRAIGNLHHVPAETLLSTVALEGCITLRSCDRPSFVL